MHLRSSCADSGPVLVHRYDSLVSRNWWRGAGTATLYNANNAYRFGFKVNLSTSPV
jgi:hypothetical protein